MYNRELVVDNFAGGGGASTGIEMAIGRSVDIAINHDPAAIAMHKANHPMTKHYAEDVWNVDPIEACEGNPVGLAWFSPDCTHFSKSRGGKPVEHHIRGLSWVVLRWALAVRPRVMMMENVEEIQTWGPLITKADGKQYPDPNHKGETFQAFIGMLTTGISSDCPALKEACSFLKIDTNSKDAIRLINGLGYDVQFNELIACDYGAPTSRKRFFLIARCDGKPIVWPEPTHGHPESMEVKAGLKKPWVPVKTCIDFSLPCPSIFDTRQNIWDKYKIRTVRPLADATLKRIAEGIRKFGSKPFLIQYHSSDAFRGQDLDRPLMTVDCSNRYALCMAFITRFNRGGNGDSLDMPLPTITAQANHYGLVLAFLTSYYGNGSNSSIDSPMPTATGHDRFGLVQVMGNEYGICDIGLRMLTPRELFDAQGFPDDYIIDVDADGNEYPRTEQVARCGNAVCPPVPAAIVRANLPEMCMKIGA